MKKDTHIILAVCIIFLCAALFLFYRGQEKSISAGELSVTEETNEENAGETVHIASECTDTPEDENECAVSVLGAVKHPGLFRYHGNARVYDAIKARGGFKKNAEKSSVNLAKLLSDGEQIQVLTKKQMKQRNSKTENSESDSGKELVNINLATKEELMKLPGIGEAKAVLIIDYRTEHGNFKNTEELMKISGIKEGIYNKIKAWITTG